MTDKDKQIAINLYAAVQQILGKGKTAEIQRTKDGIKVLEVGKSLSLAIINKDCHS